MCVVNKIGHSRGREASERHKRVWDDSADHTNEDKGIKEKDSQQGLFAFRIV